MVAIINLASSNVMVQTFIDSLSLPMSIAGGLLTTSADCDLFYKGYYGRNSFVVDDLLDYREYKIKNSFVTLEIFVNLCNSGHQLLAFESLFLQKFSPEEMVMINREFVNGKFSYQSLFLDFHKNTNLNVWRIIL